MHDDNHERGEEDTHIPRKHADDRKSNAKREVGNSEGDHVHAGLGHITSVSLQTCLLPAPDKNQDSRHQVNHVPH